jgi:hypothetical protein
MCISVIHSTCVTPFANYRGISLLPALSTVFTGVLALRLRKWAEKHKILSRFQMDFVSGRRTIDNVFVIQTIVDKYLRFKKGWVYWCFYRF